MLKNKYVSTSAVAFGRTIDKTIDWLIEQEVSGIEIAIGPRPSPLVATAIERAANEAIKLSAHANFPFENGYFHQDRDFTEIIEFCKNHGIDTYSIHAPKIGQHGLNSFFQFVEWLKPKFELAQQNNIKLAIETMYFDAIRPYWFSTWQEHFFLENHGKTNGWNKFIIADVAHLQICKNFNVHDEESIKHMLTSDSLLEVHYSDNDKIHDVHLPYVKGTNDQIENWLSYIPDSVVKIDEGRYRKHNLWN